MHFSINLADPAILAHIKTIGYPLMLVIMIAEGPIMTILAAFAASLGFFNVFIVLILSMLGDIIGDLLFYGIGYTGGTRALEKAERILKVKPLIVQRIEKLFAAHPKKTIFAVKSTTGLCWITFIAAGALRMDMQSFLIGSVGGGIIWSSFLVFMGYFFGYAFEAINDSIRYAGILITVSAILFYVALTVYKRYKSRQIMDKK